MTTDEAVKKLDQLITQLTTTELMWSQDGWAVRCILLELMELYKKDLTADK